MIYELARDASLYLVDSIIRYNSEPVFVRGVGGNFEVVANNLAKGGLVKFNLNSELVDLTPIPLGYLNTRGRAFYVSRKPKRSWRQGLSSSNLRNPRHWELVLSKRLANLINGDYPPFLEVLVKFKDGGEVEEMAFSRRFAISREGSLYYKGEEVGHLKDNNLTLHNDYQYLTEVLREDMK